MLIIRSIGMPLLPGGPRRDIVIVDGKVLAVNEPGQTPKGANLGFPVMEIQGDELQAFPGLIDPHVHTLGGGGGSGWSSYVGEPDVDDFLRAGITSVIGCLGFDCTTRTVVGLIRKARTLAQSGMGAYCLNGGFEYPPLTVTGDVRTDFVVVPEIVGAGELALHDRRGGPISDQELAHYAVQCQTAGMLSSKRGILHIHLGDDPGAFHRLYQVKERCFVSLDVFHVTHVNRHADMLAAAVPFTQQGGAIDVTTKLPQTEQGPIPPVEAVLSLLEKGAPLDRITVSTDGFGAEKTSDGFAPMPLDGLLETAKGLLAHGLSPADVAALVATNPANIYGLAGRGRLQPGYSGDILLFDQKLQEVCGVVVAGQHDDGRGDR